MYISDASPGRLLEAVDSTPTGERDVIVLLLPEGEKKRVPAIIEAFAARPTPFVGGFFPAVLHGKQQHDKGAIVLKLPMRRLPILVQHLDASVAQLPDLDPGREGGSTETCTALILADAFSSNISPFLGALFSRLGNGVNYLGGGAGSASMTQEPCVFCREGMFQNAALVVFVDYSSAFGVRHGWPRLHGPVVATKTRRNVICELNWRNALDVYRNIVESDSGEHIKLKDSYKLCQVYPFGMLKEGAEDLVRDVVRITDKGELVSLGDIPENAVLNVLKGNPESLIAAAVQAAADCADVPAGTARQTLIFSCVSRPLFLGKAFARETEAVQARISEIDARLEVEGVLSLGEISSHGEGILELFNKTVVVGLLYDAKS